MKNLWPIKTICCIYALSCLSIVIYAPPLKCLLWLPCCNNQNSPPSSPHRENHDNHQELLQKSNEIIEMQAVVQPLSTTTFHDTRCANSSTSLLRSAITTSGSQPSPRKPHDSSKKSPVALPEIVKPVQEPCHTKKSSSEDDFVMINPNEI